MSGHSTGMLTGMVLVTFLIALNKYLQNITIWRKGP